MYSSQPPISTLTITDTVTAFRAFFFFVSSSTPADALAFPAADASTVEFAAGQNLTATESGTNDYYLAYPDDGGVFQYTTGGGVILFQPEAVAGTFIRNNVDYQVFRFRGLSRNTVIAVQEI